MVHRDLRIAPICPACSVRMRRTEIRPNLRRGLISDEYLIAHFEGVIENARRESGAGPDFPDTFPAECRWCGAVWVFEDQEPAHIIDCRVSFAKRVLRIDP